MRENKLSILLITNQLIYGGAERYTVSVANGLAKRGSKVTVISRGGPMRKLLNKKVKFYFAPVRKTDVLNRLRTILTITYVSWKEKVQIVHTQSTSGAFAARVAKFFTRIPIIKTAHGWPEGQFPSVARTLNFTTDRVVMISSWLSRRLVSFGLRKEKAKIILNGIDIEKFSGVKVDREKLRRKLGFSITDKITVSVSRIVPEKQFEQMIYWFPYVLAKVPTAKLLIVGDGGADGEEYRDRLIDHTRRAGLGKSIVFLRGTDKVQEILSIADVFCTASVGKGFAVLEAMTIGLPVVARRPRGIADTVQDGVNGFLFSSSDWKTMAEKIVLLLENKRLAREFGIQGKILAQSSFSLEKMIDKLEETYDKLLDRTFVEAELVLPQKLLPTSQTSQLETAIFNE